MNTKSTGLVLILTGLIFLNLSITMPIKTPLWTVLLGVSIILNISGATILFKFIKTAKKSGE